MKNAKIRNEIKKEDINSNIVDIFDLDIVAKKIEDFYGDSKCCNSCNLNKDTQDLIKVESSTD